MHSIVGGYISYISYISYIYLHPFITHQSINRSASSIIIPSIHPPSQWFLIHYFYLPPFPSLITIIHAPTINLTSLASPSKKIPCQDQNQESYPSFINKPPINININININLFSIHNIISHHISHYIIPATCLPTYLPIYKNPQIRTPTSPFFIHIRNQIRNPYSVFDSRKRK